MLYQLRAVYLAGGGLSVRAAVLQPTHEVLRKIKLNIWIKVFVMIYKYPLKQYELNYFKFICLRWALSAAESEWAVPCTDVACCVSAARLSGGESAA